MASRITLMNSALSDSLTGGTFELPQGATALTVGHNAVKDGSSATLTISVEYSLDGNNWIVLETIRTAISASDAGATHITAIVANSPRFLRAKAVLSSASGTWNVRIFVEIV
jgi:hypothetical protein